MRLRRRGGLRLELSPGEVSLLDDLFGQLDELLASPDTSDEVVRRLFPDAYPDDPEASAEFRSLTAGSERSDRIGLCRGELGGVVDLSEPDVSDRWLRAINDVRLAVGTRLGVTADAAADIDPTDPEQHPWLVYHWLTALQDQLVVAVMR